MILLIDNYDSFTYNLYQVLALFYDEIRVIRNDRISIEQIEQLNISGIVLSPGPGRPEKAGICIEIIQKLGKKIPILGVCLGHQAIGAAFGANINRAKEILHGKESLIFHENGILFQNISHPFKAGRYHSLIVEKTDLPAALKIDALDISGHIMALSHQTYPIFGVQFHPESIMTVEGPQIVNNFINYCMKFIRLLA
jgi:anthranilate synthase component II